MLIKGIAKDDKVVEIYEADGHVKASQAFLHQSLVGRWAICKTEWHFIILYGAYRESCSFFVRFFHLYLMISRLHAHVGEVLSSM